MSESISYADAGVSIDNANLAVAKIREMARSTFNERTLTEIGSFGGMFSGAFPGMAEPILVASADGVGTKLKLAFETGIHNTVGADLVNHCVNDILVQGARPLFFIDYLATGFRLAISRGDFKTNFTQYTNVNKFILALNSGAAKLETAPAYGLNLNLVANLVNLGTPVQ